MKKLRKITAAVLSFLLLVTSSANFSVYAEENTAVTSVNSDTGSDFYDDRILILIKREYSNADTDWTELFKNIKNIAEVKEFGDFPAIKTEESESDTQVMQPLYMKFLMNDSQYVSDAVNKINEMDEVYLAVKVPFQDRYHNSFPICPVCVFTEPVSYMTGDVNGDKETDMTDLTGLSLALLKDVKLSGVNRSAADIDINGDINVADMARLQQYVSVPELIELEKPAERTNPEVCVKAMNISNLTRYDYEYDFSFDTQIGNTAFYMTDIEVITDYDEFVSCVDISKLSEEDVQKYNKEYFVNNTLIIYRDQYVNKSDSQFVLDLTVTDDEILLRTYQMNDLLADYCMFTTRDVFADIPNELYKGQRLAYATDRMAGYVFNH